MAGNTYELGSSVSLNANFTDNATPPNPLDPSSATLFVEPPGGPLQTYVWTPAAPGVISHPAVGSFSYRFTVNVRGQWLYKWEGTGAVTTAWETNFYVTGDPVFPS